ncbi:MAG: 50S ribosomal protein L18 [Ignavibacteria bacterium]|nr:50S ribosomal protein L18 [Ignavibacteria bacterium]
MKKKNLDRRKKLKLKIRKKIFGTPEKPRLVVFRSNKHIYAQIVDDINHKTLLQVSTLSKDVKQKIDGVSGKVAKAKIVGNVIAENAKNLNISKVVFDRGGYLYHGRVKAVAEGAREGGLKF